MAADASIYNQVGKFKSFNDFENEASQAEANKLAVMLHRQQYAQGEQAVADQNALRDAYRTFGTDTTANANALFSRGLGAPALAYTKSVGDAAKTTAETKQATSHAGYFDAEAASKQIDDKIKKSEYHIQQLGALTDPSQIDAWSAQGVRDGVLGMQESMQGAQQMKQFAATNGFEAAKQQALRGGMSATDQLKQQQALLIANNEQAGQDKRSAATNATHLQAAGIAAGTSRANNQANIAKDYAIAGIGANGEPSANVESMAQMIAAGKAAPISGFALARPQGQAVMARVSAINPSYDATEYGAKVKAAKDFGSGPQGNAMRSFNVAGQHLDQLGQLVDALQNGNTQIINRVGNTIAEQTGNPAPTNFDAAKDIVSKEVVKAIVAGGGGVSEREELARLMDKAKSPAQLKGVIQQYRGLMGAQHEALLQQRRAAGLSDSTLPNYTEASGSKASGDIHSQADAILRGSK